MSERSGPRRPMVLSALVLHSEVAGLSASEGIRQYTLAEVVAHRSELQGKTVWLADDERPVPGTYLISDEQTGALAPLSGAKRRNRVDLRRIVEVRDYEPRQDLAVDTDVLDVRLGRIVVYAKKGFARVAGERLWGRSTRVQYKAKYRLSRMLVRRVSGPSTRSA